MCRLILRDEAGHVNFHRDRLVRAAHPSGAGYGLWWKARFRVLGLAAASVLWVPTGSKSGLAAARSPPHPT
jgi:hypothetical protein